MSLNLPVWYVQAGTLDSTGNFTVNSQASAVLVAVKHVQTKKVHRLLLTVQHALRNGADQRSGQYHTAYRAWPPNYGYNDRTGFPVTVFSDLTPDSADPFADPQDLAFLELPPSASGAKTARLLADEFCTVGLEPLTVTGFISGQDLIDNHQGLVEYASHPNWRFVKGDDVTRICILGPGEGSPGAGVSGGGVFKGDRFVGIYRGAFVGTGEHLFLPVSGVRIWCRERDFELIDPSATSTSVDNIRDSIDKLGTELVNQALREQLTKSAELMEQLRSNVSLFKCYKNFHDSLHQVQRMLTNLEASAKTLPNPDAAEQMDDLLRIFSREAQSTETTIATLPANPPTLRLKEAAWFQQFADSIALGQSGLARSEPATCRQAVKTLRRVLRFQMPRINAELSVCAEAMNLAGLIDVFANAAVIPGISDEATKSFDSGRSSTDQVSQRLQAQLALHSAWQNLDQDFWEAEDALVRSVQTDPADFDAVWGGMYRSLQKIIDTDPAAQWAQILLPLANEVDRLRNQGDWLPLNKAFYRLQKACRNRFFDVDTSLRNLATEVAAIGESLNTLLSKLV